MGSERDQFNLDRTGSANSDGRAMTRDMIDDARAVPIAEVAAGLGLRRVGRELVGPSVRCGRRDQFSLTPPLRASGIAAVATAVDVIALAQFVHRIDFRGAVEMLIGKHPAPERKRHALPEKTKALPDDARTMSRTNRRATMQPPIGLKVTDAVEKRFLEDLCATLIQNDVESASSIQKVDSDDSIVAFQRDAADFFDSIDPSLPSMRRLSSQQSAADITDHCGPEGARSAIRASRLGLPPA